MLMDGQPDLPFLLNWCAVKWVNVWMGKAIFQTIPTNKNRAIVLQEQYFNATQEMIYDHYLWLKPFFEHPNYIRIGNNGHNNNNGDNNNDNNNNNNNNRNRNKNQQQPAFLLYYYDPRALPILESLRQFAIEDGFAGLHFIIGRSSHPEHLYDTSHFSLKNNTNNTNSTTTTTNEKKMKYNKRQREVLEAKAQSLDLVDPTKTKSTTRSILPYLGEKSKSRRGNNVNSTGTTTPTLSSSVVLEFNMTTTTTQPAADDNDDDEPKEERIWDYNPFNQTMTYPYPLEYLTRPFEVPAWCTDVNDVSNPTTTTTTTTTNGQQQQQQQQQQHPEIIGVITAFDNSPRRKFKEATVWNGGEVEGGESPDDAIARFKKSYTAAMYYQKCCTIIRTRTTKGRQQQQQQQQQQDDQQNNNNNNLEEEESTTTTTTSGSDNLKLNFLDDGRFVAINSWNEWAEGMAIEPSDVYGYRWLETIKEVQEIIQKRPCAS